MVATGLYRKPSHTFNFVFADSSGYAALNTLYVNFGAQLGSGGACWSYFAPASAQLWLANDAGTAWMGPVTLGSLSTLHNSQCTVNASGSSISGSGNDLTLNLSLSFTSSFAGSKNTYLWASDSGGLNSGWQQRGTWTVVAGVSALSMLPSSGAGASQTFSFVFADSSGYTALNTI